MIQCTTALLFQVPIQLALQSARTFLTVIGKLQERSRFSITSTLSHQSGFVVLDLLLIIQSWFVDDLGSCSELLTLLEACLSKSLLLLTFSSFGGTHRAHCALNWLFLDDLLMMILVMLQAAIVHHVLGL